jgi:ubiquinone biosynthesis protein COQ9
MSDAATIQPLEMTLDELRRALAPLLPAHAVFDGMERRRPCHGRVGARRAGRARAALLPGGPVDMVDAWFDAIDLAMARAYPLERISKLKIRERIRDLVLYRIEVINPHKEALRRALAILAQPVQGLTGPRLGLARRRPDVADRGRHFDRLQSLFQAHHSRGPLQRDDAGVPRR